jgi:ketosteroid isomerase-like protein
MMTVRLMLRSNQPWHGEGVTEPDVARTLLGELQAAVDAKDVDQMMRLFHPDGVLVGTRLYNRGPAAIRAYLLQEVVRMEESLFWDLPELDRFLDAGDAIGFSGDGRISVTSPDGDAHFPFRLTVVAERTEDTWLVRHFHGSLPSAN